MVLHDETGRVIQPDVLDFTKFPENAEDWLRLEGAFEKVRSPDNREDLFFLLDFWRYFPWLLACGAEVHFPLSNHDCVRGIHQPEYRALTRMRHWLRQAVTVFAIAAEASGLDSTKITAAARVYRKHAHGIQRMFLAAAQKEVEDSGCSVSYILHFQYQDETMFLDSFPPGKGPSRQQKAEFREGVQVLARLRTRILGGLVAGSGKPGGDETGIKTPKNDGHKTQLRDLHADVLDAMQNLKATCRDCRQPARRIAKAAVGEEDENKVKEPLAELARWEYAGSMQGRNGGSWITKTGKAALRTYRKQGKQ